MGKSGSGKSTFCKLISRLYVPNEGSVLIDKYDIQKVEISSIRRQLGIVNQDPLLFAGTIRDNISFGDESFSDKEIVDCLLYTSPSPRDISGSRMPSSA